MTKVHETSIIGQRVKIGQNVNIGPYCVIGNDVVIGDGTVLHSHVCISSNTIIGSSNAFFPFCAIGFEPQDLKFDGENSVVIIGNNNCFREYVTVNRGTKTGIMKTEVGNNCLFMASSHIAHDCIVQDGVILANNVAVAGHVQIGQGAIIGGNSAIHQFVRIGKYSIVGGMAGVDKDVPPFCVALNERAYIGGVNLVGLKRNKFSIEQIQSITNAYNFLFKENLHVTIKERLEMLKHNESYENSTYVQDFVSFIETGDRGLCKVKKH